jgi:hypothetical protein
VRVVQPGVARLVIEDDESGEAIAVVYHCLNNSRQQHASRPGAAAAAAAEGGGAEQGQQEQEDGMQRRAGKAPVEEEGEEEGEEVRGIESEALGSYFAMVRQSYGSCLAGGTVGNAGHWVMIGNYIMAIQPAASLNRTPSLRISVAGKPGIRCWHWAMH